MCVCVYIYIYIYINKYIFSGCVLWTICARGVKDEAAFVIQNKGFT